MSIISPQQPIIVYAKAVTSIGEWFYYNFAARSFHTKKLCRRLYFIELEFYSQKRQIRFEPPFGGVKGDLRTLSIAR